MIAQVGRIWKGKSFQNPIYILSSFYGDENIYISFFNMTRSPPEHGDDGRWPPYPILGGQGY